MTPPSFAFLQRGTAALVLACVAVLPALAAEPDEFSRAETLVFADNHLANLKPPIGLRYRFVRSAAQGAGFEDDAQLDVAPSGTGCCDVHGRFLTGERQLAQLPDIAGAQGNPIILYFLENDIREMARETKRKDGGNYFRNRIRRTMVDEARVKDISVDYQGRKLPAQEVSLTPYVNDPARSRYERFAAKRYVFVLAKGVPGGVYQVSTVLPGALPSDAPVQRDVLTLVDSAPAGAPASSSSSKK